MAENKRPFLLYADQDGLVQKLPDEVAGKLFKLIFDYVNDRNPTPTDLLLEIAFEPFKRQLKRDLVKYMSIKDRNRENAHKRWDKGIAPIEANETVPVEKFDFRKSLIEIGVTENIVSDWMKVRKTKRATNSETAFNKIKSEIEKSGQPADECIRVAAEHSWSGFKAEWLKNLNTNYGHGTDQNIGGNPEITGTHKVAENFDERL